MSAAVFSNLLLKCLTVLILAFNVKASGKLKFEMIRFVTNRTLQPMGQSSYHFHVFIRELNTSKPAISFYAGEYSGRSKNISFNQTSKNGRKSDVTWHFKTLPKAMKISVEVNMTNKNESVGTLAFKSTNRGRKMFGLKQLLADHGSTRFTFRVTKFCDLSFYGRKCDRFCEKGKKFTCTAEGKKKCKPNWKNPLSNCEEDKDECLISPKLCKTGLECENTYGGYTCKCPRGFTGTDCEIKVVPCNSAPCQNKGNCTNNHPDYNCTCEEGFSGKDCELDFNQCRLKPCRNGSNCTNYGTDYFCACPQGYTGKNCEDDIDECHHLTHQKNTCHNNGICINTDGGFYCRCEIPYQGNSCVEFNKDFEIRNSIWFSINFMTFVGLAAFLALFVVIFIVFCLRRCVERFTRRAQMDEKTSSRKNDSALTDTSSESDIMNLYERKKPSQRKSRGHSSRPSITL